MGRPASVVQGMNVGDKDRVISMDLVVPNKDLLVVTAKGFGKRTALSEYPVKGRAGGGVITIKLRPGDEIAAAQVVDPTDSLTLISRHGIVIKVAASSISRLGRSTQGVTIMNVGPGDAVAALSVEPPAEEGPNPNILAAAEVTAAAPASSDGRANGPAAKVK